MGNENVISRSDAAANKSCPFYASGGTTGGRCIDSECMMWRWHDKEQELGFCGLAGKP